MGKLNLGLLEKLVEKGLIKPETLELAAKAGEAIEKEPSVRDKFLARFGNDKTDPAAWKMGKSMDMAERSSQPYASGLSGPMPTAPNGKFAITQAGQEIGHPGIMEPFNNQFTDPLPWMDSKYGVTKKALAEAKANGFPVKLNTSSDLVAHNDYIDALPKGSEVNIYLPTMDANLNSSIFPGSPSRKRLEGAAEKLKQSGIKVNLVEPTKEDVLAAVGRKTKSGSLEFGKKFSPEELERALDSGAVRQDGVVKGFQDSHITNGSLSEMNSAGQPTLEGAGNGKLLPVKGIAAMGAGSFANPLDLLGKGAQAYGQAKEALYRPVAGQMDLTKDGSATQGITQTLSAVADPINLIPGAAGVGAAAIQGAGDLMAPKGYADGGMIPQSLQSAIAPSVEELAQGAGRLADAAPTAEAQRYAALKANYDQAYAGVNPVDREKLVLDQIGEERNARQYAQQSQLARTQADQQKAAQLEMAKSQMGIPTSGMAGQAMGQPSSEPTLDLQPVTRPQEIAPSQRMADSYLNTQQAVNGALDMTGQAAMMGANAAAAGAAAQSRYLQDMTAQMDSIEKQRQQQEAFRQQKMGEAQSKLSQSMEDFQKTAAIDPNRYMANKSTASKIGMGVALFFSGINGSKDGLQLIENAINRDIDAQKAGIGVKQATIGMQQNLYKNMLDQFGDQRQAELASKQALLGMAEMKLKQVMAGTESVKAIAQGQQALAEISLKKAQLAQDFQKTVLTSPAFMAQDDRLRRVSMIGNPHMQETAMKELGEYDKHKQVVDGVEEAFNGMMKNRRSLLPYTPGHSQYEADSAKLQTLTSEIFGGKSEAEFRIIQNLFPKPTDTQETAERKLDSLKQKIESQVSFPILHGMGIVKKPLPLTRAK